MFFKRLLINFHIRIEGVFNIWAVSFGLGIVYLLIIVEGKRSYRFNWLMFPVWFASEVVILLNLSTMETFLATLLMMFIGIVVAILVALKYLIKFILSS